MQFREQLYTSFHRKATMNHKFDRLPHTACEEFARMLRRDERVMHGARCITRPEAKEFPHARFASSFSTLFHSLDTFMVGVDGRLAV